MASVLLDTHAWVWTLTDDPQLSGNARKAILSADAVQISPISFFEIGQKVRIGKWPEMEPYANTLSERLRDQGGLIASLTPDICLRASLIEWEHRDPFDRIIAATAEVSGLQLVSKDTAFDSFPARLQRLW